MDPAEKRRDYYAAWRRRRIAAGICWKCGGPLAAGKSLCERHLAEQRDVDRRKRAERTAADREAYNAYMREYQKRRRARRRRMKQFEEFRRKFEGDNG